MALDLKHSPLGYFRYFYDTLGNQLIFNIVLSVFLGLLDGLGLALFIPLLQFVNESGGAGNADAMGGLAFVVKAFGLVGLPLNLVTVLGFMVLVFVIKGLLNYWLSMEQIDLRQRYMIALRMKQIEDLDNLSYQGFLRLDAGRIQNAVTAEVGKNIQAMIQFLGTLKSIIVLISYIILAFIANWQFAFFIIAGGALSNFLYKQITESVKATSIEISRRGNLFSGFIIQAIHAFKYLKATNHFYEFSSKLKTVIDEVVKLNRKIGRWQSVTGSTREPVIIFIVAAVIIIQVNFMGSTLGSILLSLLLFYRALNGLVLVQMSWQGFMQNLGGLQSISDLKVLMHKEREIQPELKFGEFTSSIELRNLNFAYNSKPALTNINMVIPKNHTVAFIGESGSGKSTLANVITTLLRTTDGNLLVDGKNIYDYNLDSFRTHIGYISQDPVIFSDSVYNNVTFWAERTAENEERFREVIRKVSLVEFIENLENKEDTVMGDNGILVSGGQKQRISIARELFKRVDILILDEATSALDSQTERFIQDSIDELQGEYTMIVIAHRLSTIKNADVIYLMDKGQISASGNYEQLLNISERFQKMVSLQHV
ncbi:ABC transporter ATP-binding protein [Mucilaginibacter terrae]|uniref:ABC-type multidrug transport system fused ATPase/permease subunit n=1 Tax=Mucilaginibacter terrae TaxID=1955052 RepID=A0ABU3GYC0_9SPHI|nr:ABC transporter ATP-binding protein [Mucilaginibacter terrae]MDT3404772.1 ABC-type multidrug transport system fused ATPase/permease subunit [Mucilaginibacter terrae]